MDKLIPINEIFVPPRARVDYGDIVSLAKKVIATKGIKFNLPAVEEVEGRFVLLQGGRRLRAHELIVTGSESVWGDRNPTPETLQKYFHMPCTILTNLTDEDRLRIELLENLDRKDFTWPEIATLVFAFHELMQKKFGKAKPGKGKDGWATRDTARELGLNPADVVYYLQLYEGIQHDPTLKDIRQKSKAITKLKRSNIVMFSDMLEITDYNYEDIRIVCGDSKNVLLTLSDESVDLVITDPPWGIGFEDRLTQERKDSLTTNYDTDYDTMDTLEVLVSCFNKMKPNTPLYMFYSAYPKKALEGQNLLTTAGFNIELIPLIWYKKHILAHQSQETRHGLNYEIILYAWKGERPFLNESHRDVFEHQVAFANRIHGSEKPESLLVEIIKLHTQEGDMVLDPFGGSCKIADACKSSLRRCLVVELEDSLVKMATMRVREL